MKTSLWHLTRRAARVSVRRALSVLPSALRFAVVRSLVDCKPEPPTGLTLKIAETREELNACFALLHDAYVGSGFMQPHPSGLRVTPYHALPTTTTLCAKLGDRVVGTLSIVREGVFGFPMQTAFDISAVRALPGRIAEISALAIDPAFRKSGGQILFPLMKFMYEYCTRYFDTRHLLIAVNPNKIELYESLLFFRRLRAQAVDRYDFANGAPAVGATLDLLEAPALFKAAYSDKPAHRNLHRYFIEAPLAAIQFPVRPWHTSNDPVMTPALIDHFFNRRVPVLQNLDERRKQLLHSLYQGPAWQAVLPALGQQDRRTAPLRAHPRFTWMCQARLLLPDAPDTSVTIVEISRAGFLARVPRALQVGMRCDVLAELALDTPSRCTAEVVRQVPTVDGTTYGFRVSQADAAWEHCVTWQEQQSAQSRHPAPLSFSGPLSAPLAVT